MTMQDPPGTTSIESQPRGMVTLQSIPGTIYNPSPGRPSAGEVVQIRGTVRARCEYSLARVRTGWGLEHQFWV